MCLDHVAEWMLVKKLKLNPDKTEFLLVGHGQHRKVYLSKFPISLNVVHTKSTDHARNLGFVLDHNFNLRDRVSAMQFLFLSYPGPAPYSPTSQL